MDLSWSLLAARQGGTPLSSQLRLPNLYYRYYYQNEHDWARLSGGPIYQQEFFKDTYTAVYTQSQLAATFVATSWDCIHQSMESQDGLSWRTPLESKTTTYMRSPPSQSRTC